MMSVPDGIVARTVPEILRDLEVSSAQAKQAQLLPELA
jgi:hypothetical protein